MATATVIFSTVYLQGAIQGLCEYNGSTCWFELDESDIDPVKDRKFAIYELDEHAQMLFDAEHKRFQEEMGYHCDHDEAIYRPMECTNLKSVATFNWQVDSQALRGEKVGVLPVTSMERYLRP